MTAVQILQAIIEILVGGITGIGQAIGSGLSTLATSIFLQTTGDTTTLSVFGGLIIVFAGISLAMSLTRWVLNYLTSLGRRNR